MVKDNRDQILRNIFWIGILFNIILGGVIIFIPNYDEDWYFSYYYLIVGIPYGPESLDPHLAWDSPSIDVINQVAEGLYKYHHEGMTHTAIPNLATGFIKDNLTYIFSLTQNASFHDGRGFNATHVKKSFDRLHYFLNATGAISNPDDITPLSDLYEWADGTFIINTTEINSEFSINITLNREFEPFLDLLCFSASYIFIPIDAKGQETLWQDYMTTSTDGFLGTGPWIYNHYEDDVEVVFNYNPTYWKGASELKKLIFSVIGNANAINQALLAGDIDFIDDPLTDFIPIFEEDPHITLKNNGQSMVIQYLGMNNQHLNITWRQVISHIFDYDFVIINSLLNGYAKRLESPIPLGITGANWIHQEAIYNLTKARIIMQSMGFGYDKYGNPWGILNTFEDNYNWTTAAQLTPFRFLNFTYHSGNQFREDLFYMLVNQFELIGVELNAAIISWDDFLNRVYERGIFNRNMLELYWIGWGPDYNDPSNYINPLFTNRSVASNSAQYNGFQAAVEAGRNPYYLWDNVQLLMEEALEETNQTTRTAMYNRIQQILVEEDMPWVYGYVSIDYDAHIRGLYGYPYNNMGELYFYPCRVNIPPI